VLREAGVSYEFGTLTAGSIAGAHHPA